MARGLGPHRHAGDARSSASAARAITFAEQGLALANVEAMLRPGGLLLSNNAVRERPASCMRSIGCKTVVYCDRPDDGDHIVFYQRRPSGPWRMRAPLC